MAYSPARRWLRTLRPMRHASFDAWLTATVRREHVLCELEPTVTLLGFEAADGYDDTYVVACPRFAQTHVYPGGLYRPVIGVTVNDVPLEAQASVVEVDTHAGSYWWDEAGELLYVHTPSGASPNSFTLVAATVRLHFANAPVVLEREPGVPASAVYYHPWLTNELPQIRRQVEDLLSGAMVVPTGRVSFTNGHGAWWTWVATDGAWNWKYRPAHFYIGGSYGTETLTRAQYAQMASMRIEDVAPNDVTCAFPLVPLQRFAETHVPVTPMFTDAYPHLGSGVSGSKKWIGYGRATIAPDLTDASGYGVYTCADAAFQTLFAVHEVWAIDRQTGARTTLMPTTDYVANLADCTVAIVNATYHHDDYTLAVDLTGKPDGSGGYLHTAAAIVRDLLTSHLGPTIGAVDTSAFAVAAAEADAELSVWVKSPRALTSLMATSQAEMPSIGRSVMGAVQQTIDGRWTMRIWNPDVDAIDTTLAQRDFAKFAPKPKLKTIYSTVNVYYNFDHVRQEWAVASVSSPATRFRTESHEPLEIYTFLRSRSNAQTMAQRYLLLAGLVTTEAEFEERGALLARHNGGGKALVSYAPAPNVAGAYDGQPFEVLSMEVSLAPKLRVTGVMGDLRGLGGRVGRWTASDAPDYLTATPAERLASGYWTDAGGLADPSDPMSGGRSIWW